MALQLYSTSFYDIEKTRSVINIPKTLNEIIELAKDSRIDKLLVTYNGQFLNWREFVNMIDAQKKEVAQKKVFNIIKMTVQNYNSGIQEIEFEYIDTEKLDTDVSPKRQHWKFNKKDWELIKLMVEFSKVV